jgi:DNA-binding response OmpR family regulator
MLEFLLKLENYEVRTAHTGNQALETAAAFEPEIALLDIGLPDLSGYELGRRLREKFPALRLLAVSGWGQEEDRRRSAAAGFEHHLVKPVEFEELLRLIRF